MAMTQSFPEMVRNARLAKELTFRDVARFVGISAGCISEIERGRRLPPKDEKTLARFAKLLGLNRDDVVQSASLTRKARTDNTLGQVLAQDPDLALAFFRMVENGDNDSIKEALRKAVEIVSAKEDAHE